MSETEEHAYEEILAGLEAFLRAEVVPRHERAGELLTDPRLFWGPDGRYVPEVLGLAREVREAASQAGFYTMLASEELGGGGLGFEALYRSWELVFRVCGTHHWLGQQALAHWARGPTKLLLQAQPAMRDLLLGDLMAGRTTLCFAMSEAEAGSDAWRMQTTATPTGAGGWCISGSKQWITNGPYADHVIVFAVTDRDAVAGRSGGISAFVVPADASGFRVESVIQMFGHSGGDEGVLVFDEVEVGADALIGELGNGLTTAMAGVSSGRLYNSARSIGLARWALAMALGYAQERQTWGRPIFENQAVSFPLADSAMELRAARLLGLDCARRLDAGAAGRGELSMAKAFSTETAVRVIDRCIQVHGAMGFTNEVGLAEAWQVARRICVADGSSEILRRQIARELARGDIPY